MNHLIVLHKHCNSFLKNGLQDSMTWQWEKIIADSNTLKDENTKDMGQHSSRNNSRYGERKAVQKQLYTNQKMHFSVKVPLPDLLYLFFSEAPTFTAVSGYFSSSMDNLHLSVRTRLFVRRTGLLPVVKKILVIMRSG